MFFSSNQVSLESVLDGALTGNRAETDGEMSVCDDDLQRAVYGEGGYRMTFGG